MQKNRDEQAVTKLWEEYQKNKNTDIRDQLVEHYLPMVNIIAGRLAISLPPHVDRDDLISSGFFGLLDAVDRYDYRRGNKFETYAGVRIRGSMLDYLRSKDWISVSLRQKIRKYENAVGALEARLGRSATDTEIAQELGLSMDQLHQLELQMNVATVIPLEEYIRSESADDSLRDPSSSVEHIELREVLATALDSLPDKEKLVMSLYYYEELTMKEISFILKLSEARICQLHTKAIMRLRGSLGQEKADFC